MQFWGDYMTEKYPDFIKATGYGTVTGLCGANCYHSFSPFLPGISVPNYTDDELKKMNEQENTPVEYNGKKYTKYEATQRQRSLERTLHAKNQKVELLKLGSADENDIKIAEANYRKTSHEYAQFSKSMGLPQQRQRVQIKNIENSLTFDKNSGNINNRIRNQFYAPLNEKNADDFLSALVKFKGDKLSLEENEILLIRNKALEELKQIADKNKKAEYTAYWNVILANMQKPFKFSELPDNFCDKLIQSINSRHISGQYDAVLRMFNSVVKNIPVLNQYTIGNSFYASIAYLSQTGKETLISGININKLNFFKNDYVTELHEIGHYIDNEVLKINKKSFRDTLLNDFKKFSEYKRIDNINWSEVFDLAPELSDILSGITLGKIHGKTAHDNSYWLIDESKLPAETFAHFFEATIRNDKKKIEIYKAIFPNSYKKFLIFFG